VPAKTLFRCEPFSLGYASAGSLLMTALDCTASGRSTVVVVVVVAASLRKSIAEEVFYDINSLVLPAVRSPSAL
jgi:hypothetical protein